MTIFTCVAEWEAMLSCMYEARYSGIRVQDLELHLEPIHQYTLFDNYIHVDADPVKARKVSQAIQNKISPYVYQQLAFTALSFEDIALNNIYRVMLLGFHYGSSVLDMLQYKDVMENMQLRKRVCTEIGHFREFLRFHEIQEGLWKGNNGDGEKVYVAHIEPRCRVLEGIAPHFADRMPSEHWIIVDDIHMVAAIHPRNEDFYFRYLTKDEYDQLVRSEEINDSYTDLWKIFFKVIEIKERHNEKCQSNLFPKWTRKHAVEFFS